MDLQILWLLLIVLFVLLAVFAIFLFRTNNKNTEILTELKLMTELRNHLLHQNEKLRTDLHSEQLERTRLSAEYQSQRERIAELSQMKESLSKEFEGLAVKVFSEKGDRFAAINRESITQLLQPFDEQMKQFRTSLQSSTIEDTKQRTSLMEQIRQLHEQTNLVSQQANNLATALKGKSKTRGNWGEMVLESVLHQAGMQEGRDYELQSTYQDAESGKALRPDVLIRLPQDRIIVVDSKVSLVAYDDYCASENPEEQANLIKQHLLSVRTHIDQLSSKRYDDLPQAPNFTILFLPIEPAYMIALQADGTLWNYAYGRRIMLVSPSNLLPCIHLINDIWIREKQNLNAQRIVQQGQGLYEKLVTFVETLVNVGSSIEKAKENYEKAMAQLSSGRGNLLRRAEEMRRLGLNPKKQLDPSMTEDEETDE